MKKTLPVTLILVLCALWMMAQQSSTSSNSQSASSSETTIQGCVSGSGGNYTLTDKSGDT